VEANRNAKRKTRSVKKEEKQELEKKRKIEWKIRKRMSKNEPALSYDEWDEEQKQKAEAEEES
jgi:hypothetical protein